MTWGGQEIRPDLAAAVVDADASRLAVRDKVAGRGAELPLRFWRQQAHLTAPAADAAMARKAVEGGTAPLAGIMARLGLTASDLAEHLELPADRVASRLEMPARAPLVMLDGEDSIPPGDEAAARAIAVAADTFAAADWGSRDTGSLRFYRPPGLNLDTTVRDLYRLLWRLAEQSDTAGAPGSLPIDGIVFPKIDHPEEVDLVNELLARAERALGLPVGQIRVAYLIESGWAVARLADIAQRGATRLAGLIFGIADFSADLGLPAIGNEHPLATSARAQIVTVAGAVGVPAIDGMTLDYPVIDASLDDSANRHRWLDRMRLVYNDAARARDLGMLGKWVGHPAQLFAVLLAYEARHGVDAIEHEAAKLEAYQLAVATEKGATMISGVMSDRATDRHARALLRQATALGQFDPDRALRLGVINPGDASDARRARRAWLAYDGSRT